jgi:hypothetical protein
MELKLYTRLNANGNSYKLAIDTEAKTVKKGYDVYMGKGDTVATKQTINAIYDIRVNEGYKVL